MFVLLKFINIQMFFVTVCKLCSGKFQKVFFFSSYVRNVNEITFYTKTIFCNKNNIKFFEKIVSIDSLIIAFKQLTSYLKKFFFANILEFVAKMDRVWFKNFNEAILRKNYKCFSWRKSLISKFDKKIVRPFLIVHFQVKIIEKTVLNFLKPFFEGVWKWCKHFEKEILTKKLFIWIYEYKINKNGWSKKRWILKKIFSSLNQNLCFKNSIHLSLKIIKKWPTSVIWVFEYDITVFFEVSNQKRLCNVFLKHINQPRVWLEINKILKLGEIIIDSNFNNKKILQGSFLGPLLFNVYMNELDIFMLKLSKKCNRHCGIYAKVPCLFYSRYAGDFVVGIAGSRFFAMEIKNLVALFVKKNLHLSNKCFLISGIRKDVRFLNYRVCLVIFSKKKSVVNYEIQATKSYKRRVLEILSNSNKKFVKASFFLARGSFLDMYRYILNSTKLKWSKCNSQDIFRNFVLNNVSNVFHESFLLKKWIKSYKERFNQTMYFSTKFSIENLENSIPSIKLNNEMFLYFSALKKSFLNKLNSMVFQKFGQTSCNSQKKLSNIRNKRNVFCSKIKMSLFMGASRKKSLFRSIVVLSPIKDIYNYLRLKGFFHSRFNRACANVYFFLYSDAEIVEFYSIVMYGLLFYYQAADNFTKIKNLLFHLHKSCIFTLARKHNKNKTWVYKIYGDNIVVNLNKFTTVGLPTRAYIFRLSKKFLTDDFFLNFNLSNVFDRYNVCSILMNYYNCVVFGCVSKGVNIYDIVKLCRKIKSLSVLLKLMTSKLLFLCRKHFLEFCSNKYNELNSEYLFNAVNRRNNRI